MDGTVQGRWRRLEHQVSSRIASARGEARLLLARTECLQRAVRLSEGVAVRDILREFADLDLGQVVGEVVAVLRECLIVMITTTGTGALIGGVAGGLGGAGVGAVPGAALGATAGAQLGEWILAFMGLKALATYIVAEMPRIARLYWRGIQEAWMAARPSSLPQQSVHEDNAAIGRAAESIARGHVAMFVLLLAGIVAYLSKGKGSAGALAKSVERSRLGPKFAQWLVKNESRLKADGRLRLREAEEVSGGALDTAKDASTAPTRRRPVASSHSQNRAPVSDGTPIKSARVTRFGNVPDGVSTSSKVVIHPTAGKTTTVLGSYSSDMDGIINGQLAYPKTTDFGPKPGGFNVLNVPDSMWKSRSAEQFWNQVNAPFLDAAIGRGDPIYVATTPEASVLVRGDGSLTGFGREMEYLAKNGYTYDPATGLMTKPGG